MPFCPKCRDEFQDWVKVCPDCKVALVDKLKDIPKTVFQDEPLVYVVTVPNEAIAGMWAGILENEGIPCVLKSDNLRPAQYSLLYNQYQSIYVLKSAQRRAKIALQPFKREARIYAHTEVYSPPIVTRILLVICAVTAVAGGWSEGYLIGMIILWISYRLKGRKYLE